MYRSEQAFSSALCEMLRRHSPMVCRIETGTTRRGVPDIYMVHNGAEIWIETKNVKSASVEDDEWGVTWESGQQAWAYDYFRAHNKKKWSYTMVALKDGFLLIPMTKAFLPMFRHKFQGKVRVAYKVVLEDTYRARNMAYIVKALFHNAQNAPFSEYVGH